MNTLESIGKISIESSFGTYNYQSVGNFGVGKSFFYGCTAKLLSLVSLSVKINER